jgi:MFS family permease
MSVLAGRGFHDTLAGFVTEIMNGSAARLGAMVAAAGAGSLVVSLWLILTPPPDYFRQLIAGLGAIVAAFLLIGEFDGEKWALAGAAFLGCGLSLSSAAAQCIALNEAPQALRGRVMGIYTTIWRGGPPLGIMTVSLLADQFGFRAIPTILATAIAVLMLLMALAGPVSVRRSR